MRRRRLFSLLGIVTLVLMLASLPFMSACAKPAPAPAPAPAPKPSPAPAPAPTPAPEKVALKVVSFLPTFMDEVRFAGVFANLVTEQSKGQVTIEWIGGPEAIPMFQQAQAVSRGLVDMSLLPSSFYADALPESYPFFLSEYTATEERENGFYDWMVGLHKEKTNTMYLGRTGNGQPFHLLTNTYVKTPYDLAGQRFALSGPHLAIFIKALGAAPVNMDEMDFYTAMERGVVDGCVRIPSFAMATSMWEVTDYFIDHPFYEGNLVLIMNLDAWNKVPVQFQQMMIDIMTELEPEIRAYYLEAQAKGKQAMVDNGVELIEFSSSDVEWFTDLSRSSLWEETEKMVSPESYIKLRQFLSK